MFVATRFRCVEVLFHIFHCYGARKIVRYSEDFVIVPLYDKDLDSANSGGTPGMNMDWPKTRRSPKCMHG